MDNYNELRLDKDLKVLWELFNPELKIIDNQDFQDYFELLKSKFELKYNEAFNKDQVVRDNIKLMGYVFENGNMNRDIVLYIQMNMTSELPSEQFEKYGISLAENGGIPTNYDFFLLNGDCQMDLLNRHYVDFKEGYRTKIEHRYFNLSLKLYKEITHSTDAQNPISNSENTTFKEILDAYTKIATEYFDATCVPSYILTYYKSVINGYCKTKFAFYLKKKYIDNNMIENKEPSIKPNNLPQITWHGEKKRDLAYIFWQLQKKNLIQCEQLGKTLSLIFHYDNAPIENTYFNAEFKKFNNGELPANAHELDKILLMPKKVHTILK